MNQPDRLTPLNSGTKPVPPAVGPETGAAASAGPTAAGPVRGVGKPETSERTTRSSRFCTAKPQDARRGRRAATADRIRSSPNRQPPIRDSMIPSLTRLQKPPGQPPLPAAFRAHLDRGSDRSVLQQEGTTQQDADPCTRPGCAPYQASSPGSVNALTPRCHP